MSNRIGMSPDEMDMKSGQMKEQGAAFEAAITQMQSIIDSLDGQWEGKAQQAFRDQFAHLKTSSFEPMRQLVDDIGYQLTQTAQAMRDMDDKIAGMFTAG